MVACHETARYSVDECFEECAFVVTCTYVACMYACMHVSMYVCMYVRMYVCIYVCMYNICMHACMCSMYQYVCTCTCVCVRCTCLCTGCSSCTHSLWDTRTCEVVKKVKMDEVVTSFDLSWDRSQLVVAHGQSVSFVDATR